ncbi:hypothetical protein D9M71_695830 [compost metagenome]
MAGNGVGQHEVHRLALDIAGQQVLHPDQYHQQENNAHAAEGHVQGHRQLLAAGKVAGQQGRAEQRQRNQQQDAKAQAAHSHAHAQSGQFEHAFLHKRQAP